LLTRQKSRFVATAPVESYQRTYSRIAELLSLDKIVLNPSLSFFNQPAKVKSISPVDIAALSAIEKDSELSASKSAALLILPAILATVLLSTKVFDPTESARFPEASSIFQ